MSSGRSQSYGAIVWRQFARKRLAVACLIFVVLCASVALFAPLLANDRPIIVRYGGRWYAPALRSHPDLAGVDFGSLKERGDAGVVIVMPPVGFGPTSYDLDSVLSPPTLKHPLGTDGDGRDVLAQLIWGSRVSLSVGLVAVGIALAIGVFLGALAGFYGGWVDIALSRLIEIMMCFPTFFLILAVLAFVGPSIYNIMAAIGITGWTGVARLVRGECLKLKGREFVKAAVALGAGDWRIIWRHLLPGAVAPVLISATFGIAGAILAESSLSFLGFGVGPSTPSWGSLLSHAQQFTDVAPWLTLAPGSAIFATIMSYNLIGEAMRDAVDPNLKT